MLFTQITACRNHLASTLGAESLAEQESLGHHMSIGEALALASDELDQLQPQP